MSQFTVCPSPGTWDAIIPRSLSNNDIKMTLPVAVAREFGRDSIASLQKASTERTKAKEAAKGKTGRKAKAPAKVKKSLARAAGKRKAVEIEVEDVVVALKRNGRLAEKKARK